ncbi:MULTISPECIES: pilus assembly FimT family protein [Shewanella]|uniref:Type II secretion system protein n=1 Tax=Shewanella marisflavi TaxID=260364 RepID=A0ABX5WJZ0_9GAMM|nr:MULTISPECIES: prepilin-type N-terminal cleavage/methylation domain-containing protein [Shewanella]QDF74000.1 type II secretion system protein [Shewanella marisflavi]
MNKQQGFTLVELVTTIILIAILSMVVLPRFFTASSYSAYTLRDELISELRRVQLMALNNLDRCYKVSVTEAAYRADTYGADCSSLLVTGTSQSLPRQTSLSLGGLNSFTLQFDRDGRVAGSCTAGCNIKVAADDTLDLIIESQGYIHGR